MFSGAGASALQTPIRNLARKRRWRHLDLRAESELTSGVLSSAKFYRHTLDLRPGLEQIFSGFHSSVRRAIRKAEASGLTLQIEQTQEAMRDFQSLHIRTRRRHGVPPQPPAFFRHIHEEIIKPGQGFIAIARRGPIALAAEVFFIWKEKALYKFGASEQSSQSLRANNLVMWEAIRHLANKGIQELDFGRTAVDHEGLRRFKLGWGTEERLIPYSRFDVAAGEWRPARSTNPTLLTHLFGHMPLVVNQLAGRLLYPHLD
jgi:lipid II:glycine glycyltransferase (peptidoglycan interpeptide bridge formation enzyme)